MQKNKLYKNVLILIFCFIIPAVICACASLAASAEEYYLIGMAYFDLGKYEEAEIWLNRAKQADRTKTASTYNLGRLAYERKRYDEAAKHFEDILKQDPQNVHALKAAAYTRIRTGDLAAADMYYARLLALVPESADDGYNHALVLYAMERYGEAQGVLEKYPFALLDNKDVMLLYARTLNAQNKIEAVDCYAAWLNIHFDPKVRYEYASILEQYEYYARSLEEYRKSLLETPAASVNPKRNEIHFSIARVLLTADSASPEGILELETASENGFDNTEEIEKLLNIKGLSQANITGIHEIINKIKNAPENKDIDIIEGILENNSNSGS